MSMSFMLDFKRDIGMFTHKRTIIFHSQNGYVKKKKEEKINPLKSQCMFIHFRAYAWKFCLMILIDAWE